MPLRLCSLHHTEQLLAAADGLAVTRVLTRVWVFQIPFDGKAMRDAREQLDVVFLLVGPQQVNCLPPGFGIESLISLRTGEEKGVCDFVSAPALMGAAAHLVVMHSTGLTFQGKKVLLFEQ